MRLELLLRIVWGCFVRKGMEEGWKRWGVGWLVVGLFWWDWDGFLFKYFFFCDQKKGKEKGEKLRMGAKRILALLLIVLFKKKKKKKNGLKKKKSPKKSKSMREGEKRLLPIKRLLWTLLFSFFSCSLFLSSLR